jgi:hypothetical protein
MPLRRDEISNAARNHVLNDLQVPCSSVPDVRFVMVAIGALEPDARAAALGFHLAFRPIGIAKKSGT